MLTAILLAGLGPFRVPHIVHASSTYSGAVLADTPSVYYRLGESSGSTAADASGNGIQGTYAASGVTYGAAGALTSDTDTAVTSAGTSAVVTAPAGSLPGGNSSVTLEVWAKLTSGGSLLEYGDGNHDVGIAVWGSSSAPQLRLRFSGAQHIDIALPYAVPYDGGWHAYAISWDGTTALFYLDGQQIGSGTSGPLTTQASGQRLYVGSDAAGDTAQGSFDEAAVYATALGADRVNAHWRAGNAATCPTAPTTGYAAAVLNDAPVRYLRLNENAGRIAADTSSACRAASFVATAQRSTVAGPAGETGSVTGTGPFAFGSAAGLPSGNSPRSIEAWAKGASQNATILSYGDGGSDFGLRVLPGNYEGLRIGDGQAYDAQLHEPDFFDGRWHHFVLTFDGSTVIYYLDGQVVYTYGLGSINTHVPGRGGLILGGDAGAGHPWTGSIDDVAVYPTALSVAQVNTHWRAGTGAGCGSTPTTGYGAAVAANQPLRFYQFGDGGSRALLDSSGSCHVGNYIAGAGHERGTDIAAPNTAANGTAEVAFASADGLPAYANPRTLVVWAKTPTAMNETLAVYGQGDDFGIGVWGNTSTPLVRVRFNGADHIDIQLNAGSIFDGRWHQYAAAYDGTHVYTYYDGVLVNTNNKGTIATRPFLGPLIIGGDPNDSSFSGAIEEVAVYDHVLSGAQVSGDLSAMLPAGGLLSAQEMYGLCNPTFCAASSGARPARAEPVDPATGNVSETSHDLTVPGRGFPLDFSRTYNSLAAATTGPLGFGWTDSCNASLTVNSLTQAVTVSQSDGAQVVFASNAGTYTAAPRVIATLTKNGDGSYTFVRNRRDTLTFSSAGQLTSATDLNGYTTTLTYVAGQLTTVTDPASRTLTLSYSGGHISTVADQTGRTVQFGYSDGAGNLTDVTDLNGGHWCPESTFLDTRGGK